VLRVEGRLPAWRVAGLTWILALLTLVVLAGFLQGWLRVGPSGWAMANRFAGWFVVLAYVATGALAALSGGQGGVFAVLRAFVGAGVVVAIAELVSLKLAASGLIPSLRWDGLRASGFSENPNAFAFLLSLAVAVVLASGGRLLDAAPRTRWLVPLILGVLLAGLWFAASRAAFGAVGVVAVLLIVLGDVPVGRVLAGGAVAVALVAVASVTGAAGESAVWPGLFDADSDSERWRSVLGGLAMWRDHPLFGAGLGAFVATHTGADGKPLIIHSTPVWLLAEFGLIGAAAFIGAFARVAWSVRPWRGQGGDDPAGRVVLAALVVFAVSCAVHELLYQRALWLLLGACLALPVSGGAPPTSARAAPADR